MAKIVHINTVNTPTNSVARIMRTIAGRLHDYGHSVKIAAQTTGGDSDWRLGLPWSRYTHTLLSRLNDSEGLHCLTTTQRLIKELQRFQPDLIHLHNLHGHYLHLPTLFDYLRSEQLPVVMTMHDCWWWTGHCAYYSHRDCEPGRERCSRCRYHRLEYPMSYIGRGDSNLMLKQELLNSIQPQLHLVAPSQWLRNEFMRHSSIDIDPHVIYNGTPRISPERNHPRQDYLIAVAATWTPNKGLDDIVRLAESGLCDVPITIVGNLRGQRLPRSVTHIPHIQSADRLSRLYSGASALINPSHADAFGLVTVEAMSHGIPVIGNRGTATAEIIGTSGGIAIDTRHAAEIADALATIATHPDYLAPRSRYLDSFTDESMADNYLELINTLL